MHNNQLKIPIVKHLEDVDDLSIGRDTGIIPGQGHLARKLADEIYKYATEGDYKILLFTISSKKRAVETAEMVRDILYRKKSGIKIIFEINKDLREIDQGEFILPESYSPGDYFKGLKIAGKIFSSETFSEDDNLLYSFGSPYADNNILKYPQLQGYFNGYGETYQSVLLRFYGQVLRLSKNIEMLDKRGVGVTIFTHGQPHQIFTDLSMVAENIKRNGFVLKKGDLPRTCWNLYKARRKGIIPFGEVVYVSTEHIYDKNMIKILKREISFLQNI